MDFSTLLVMERGAWARKYKGGVEEGKERGVWKEGRERKDRDEK